jgi:hypothetical protein
LDEWISLLDSLKAKQKRREDRIGKAGEETAQSRQAQENLSRRWINKDLLSAHETDDCDNESVAEDLLIQSVGPSPSTSQSLINTSSSVSIREQTSRTTTSSNRFRQKRTQQQPLPLQPLTDIAAGIQSIAAEMKAERERATQALQNEELLRLDIKVAELQESIDKRLAESEKKQNIVLSILLKLESQQSKERE